MSPDLVRRARRLAARRARLLVLARREQAAVRVPAAARVPAVVRVPAAARRSERVVTRG